MDGVTGLGFKIDAIDGKKRVTFVAMPWTELCNLNLGLKHNDRYSWELL